MGWTKGERGKPYYTFLAWRNGKLGKVYAGRGEEGERVQQERIEARDEDRRIRNEFLELASLAKQYESLAKEYMADVLFDRGYVFNWGRWYFRTSIKGKRGKYKPRKVKS